MQYFEDFAPGQTYRGRTTVRVTEADIKRFAREFDPQRFHLEDAAARASFFHELVASGWHTTALMMRLLVEGDLRPVNGIIGASFEELRWTRPVRPGDELRVASEILLVTPSRSKPDRGFVKVRTTVSNQTDEPVLVAVGNLVVLRR